ncbi:unnamed protein product [Urochloa decumbens]|uniref:Pectinesterase n=1 Tax=Urochloa decumbens TaxID=240449 RepID=A0ABC9FFQ1_9POAL
MSSAFGDFGPLTERRKAEKARQQKRRIMIAVGTVTIVAVLIVIGAAAIAYTGKSSSEGSHKASKASPSKAKSGHSPSSDSESSDSSPSSDSSSSPSSSDDSKAPAAGGDLKAVSKSIKVMCSQTDYTDACEKSLGKAAAKNASAASPKDIVRTAVEVIGDAIGEAFGRADLILSNDPRVKAAVDDCKEIFGDAKDDLNRTVHGVDGGGFGKEDASYQLQIWLSAVIAHMETCIDGFPDDEFKAKVKDSFTSGKELTSNALALIEKGSSLLSVFKGSSKRRLLGNGGEEGSSSSGPKLDKDGIPVWVPEAERRVLKGGGFKNTLTPNVVVAKDGSGKFKTIGEALSAMPKVRKERYVIQVKEGVYEEYVTVTRAMANVTLLGEGSKKSIVTGKKSFADGVTTFKTATFTAQGDGFMAIGMGFQNTAGPEKHQAVALLVQSDKSIFLNCRMDAFQDTLYAHSKAQFYRNCVISGTVDFIFGDAAAVFQNCILVLRRPLDNQQNIATAQGRADAREATGFVFQKCEFQAETALRDAAKPPIRNYLGRPWRECSRILIMESEIPDFIDKAGYMPWQGDFGLKTLWYAEYANTGPGANTAGRVTWPGYKKVISKTDAAKFTVENFLHAQPWIDPTGTPVKYDLFT